MPYLYVETAGYHLCKGDRLIFGGLCNSTLLPSALRSSTGTNGIAGALSTKTVRVVFPEQSTDAIIYVTVVIVFYAAIILLLIGTNLKRFRGIPGRTPPAPAKESIIFVESNGSSAIVSTSPKEAEEFLNPLRRTDVAIV